MTPAEYSTASRAPAITSVASLRKHLQTAIEIEHATIPPYLTAWLSIREGNNYDAAQAIRSVLLEEMLHLTLAANLMNAVGGRPSLTHANFVPRYPHRLPHCGAPFQVSIEKFSPAAIETFLKIERPEPEGGYPEPGHYHTIKQFYDAIAAGIDSLCKRLGEKRVFTGDRRLQVRPEDFYGSGAVVVVKGRETAQKAMAQIVTQGEGVHDTCFDDDARIFGDGDGKEVAHYYRFMEIREQRNYTERDTPTSGPTGAAMPVDYKAVYPIRTNTRIADFRGQPAIHAALESFSRGYGELLAALERSFTGERTRLTEAIARMFSVKAQALALMNTPSGDGRTNVGLAFGQHTR